MIAFPKQQDQVSNSYIIDTTLKIVILPNFLVWKFCENTQLPQSFRRIARDSAETARFNKIYTPGN